VVLGVDVRATVAQPQNVWHLLLDLSDDHSQRGGESRDGTKKIANIKTAGNSGSVVAFKDGYEDRKPNTSTEYDVVVDAYQILLTRAGEGVGSVVLKEIT
jgi:hypothetical protein